jgi:hypothetical protein
MDKEITNLGEEQKEKSESVEGLIFYVLRASYSPLLLTLIMMCI